MGQSLAQIITLLSPHNLHHLTRGLAYLDPGSGSFILQLIIATLLGAAFLLRGYLRRAYNFIRNLFSRRGGDDEK